MPKRVLLITYYWPPSGGPGVYRWLRMTNHMPDCGYEVTVYTPENPHYTQLDEAGLAHVNPRLKVIGHPIFEVTRWFEKLSRKKTGTALLSEKKKGRLSNLPLLIRGNLFIPDPKIFWVKPSIRFLENYLRQNPVDMVITTGPPHSLHLIGLALQKKGLKWVADFRDPWTNIDFYRELQLTAPADAKHRRLEKKVLAHADMVTVIGETMKKEFDELGARNCIVVTNGFEFRTDTENIYPQAFTLTHYGSVAAARNPEVLWKALAALRSENGEAARAIRVRFVGTVDYSVKKSVEDHGLADVVDYEGSVTHAESLVRQRRDALLLLIANRSPNAKGILTGKFFEYLDTGRPILAIGPHDGDLAHAIQKTESGKIFDYEDVAALKTFLAQAYQEYQNGRLGTLPAKKEQYDTRAITENFCRQADKLWEGK